MWLWLKLTPVVTVLITSHWQHAHHARNLFASVYFSRGNRKKPVVLSHTPTECYASPGKRSISFGFRLKMKINVNSWLRSEDRRHKKCIWKERRVSPRLGRGSVLNWTLCVCPCVCACLCVYICVFMHVCVCVFAGLWFSCSSSPSGQILCNMLSSFDAMSVCTPIV